VLTKRVANPAKAARLSPRPNSESMKRHPAIPSVDGLNPGSSHHRRNISQPDFPIRNLVAGEQEAWKADRPRASQSDPSTPPGEGDGSGPGLSRFLSAKKSFAQMFNPSQKAQSDTGVVSPSARTSMEEAQVPSPTSKEEGDIDRQLEADVQRAMEESLREQAQNRVEEEYALGPSHAWHNSVSEQPGPPYSLFDPYPRSTPFQNNPTEQPRPNSPRRTYSTDEELQLALEISRFDRGLMHTSVPVPTIEVHEQPLHTPSEELQKALELSQIDY
jgi:hypothetical protein